MIPRKLKKQVKQSVFRYTTSYPTFWIALAVVLTIFLILVGLNAFLKSI